MRAGRSFWRERGSSIGSLTKTMNGKMPARCAKSWVHISTGRTRWKSTLRFGLPYPTEMMESIIGPPFIKTSVRWIVPVTRAGLDPTANLRHFFTGTTVNPTMLVVSLWFNLSGLIGVQHGMMPLARLAMETLSAVARSRESSLKEPP